MAITFRQVLPYNVGSASFTSGAFTPNAAGDTLPFFALNSGTNDLITAMTGGSTYVLGASQINPAENVATSLACVAGSQTYSTTIAGGTTRCFMLDYSGVGSIGTSDTVYRATPGTGSGAILGTSRTVPTGSVLLACCVNNNTGVSTITSTAGTIRSNGLTSDSWEFCITEYAGTGAAIQPAYTSADGGTQSFAVLQVILTPAVASGASTAWVRGI
jgi:hypothetical protein